MKNPLSALANTLGDKIDDTIEAALISILRRGEIKLRRVDTRSQLAALIELDPDRATDYQAALTAIAH